MFRKFLPILKKVLVKRKEDRVKTVPAKYVRKILVGAVPSDLVTEVSLPSPQTDIW